MALTAMTRGGGRPGQGTAVAASTRVADRAEIVRGLAPAILCFTIASNCSTSKGCHPTNLFLGRLARSVKGARKARMVRREADA